MNSFLDVIYENGSRMRYEATFSELLDNGDAIIKNVMTPIGMVYEEFIIPASENKQYPKAGRKFAFLATLRQKPGFERMIYDFVNIKYIENIKYSGEGEKDGLHGSTSKRGGKRR